MCASERSHISWEKCFCKRRSRYKIGPNALVAYGVSDWTNFKKYLAPKIGYVNTQFDPALGQDVLSLDITAPPAHLQNTADLVICSDVLEHVLAPVQRAFDGLGKLLRPGGVVVFSVPYSFEKTIEHFPELYDWTLTGKGDARALTNTTQDGRHQRFENLVFHGGGASVLEMRLFGLDALRQHFDAAGFSVISLMDYDVLEYGIRFGFTWGRPMVATRL